MIVDDGAVVRRFWELIEARQWDDAEKLLAEDLVIDWPHNGEPIEGRDNYIAINRHYPEGWHIQVLTAVAGNGRACVNARVPHASWTTPL